MTGAGQAQPMEHTSPPRAGDVIVNRYRLEYVLGQGGMGAVFAATDLRTSRSCAVKLVRADLAGSDELRRRFEREARTAAKLQVENVVSVLDLGEHRGQPFLVMELLAGVDLRELITNHGPLPLPRALDLTLQACRGLEAVHAEGITHRDLKPKNVFVARHANGRDLVKVLDFGLAKSHAQAGSGTSTQTGQVLGTFQYMPPEQLRGEAAGVRSDVYALGAVLFEALAGEPPYESAEPHVLMHRIMYEAPRVLETLRPGLPAPVYALVERALAKEPKERFADARELGRAIQELLGERVEPEADTGRAALSSPNLVVPRGRARRVRRAAPIAIALLLGGLLLGVLVGSRLGSARPEPRPPTADLASEKPRTPEPKTAPRLAPATPEPPRVAAAPAVLSSAPVPEAGGAVTPVAAPQRPRRPPTSARRPPAPASAPKSGEGLDRENPYE